MRPDIWDYAGVFIAITFFGVIPLIFLLWVIAQSMARPIGGT